MKIPRHKIYIPFLKIFKSLFLILIDFNNKPGNFNIKLLEKIKLFFNVKYSLTVSTWRIGFFYALRALEFQKNDEILISAISIPDQINCIEILGLKPIFVDLDEETHGMCIEDLKKKISEKTKAIHITYLSGIIPDLDPIISLAKDNNLKIIEDISQAYGATYNNKIVGTIGDIGIGSMSLGKTVASLYGGMIITNNAKISNKARYLISQAKDDNINYIHNEVGYNFRISNLHAAIGLAQFEKIENFLNKKRKIHEFYKKEINKIPGLSILDNPEYAYSNNWLNILQINHSVYNKNKKLIIKEFKKNNIEVRPVWYLNHLQRPYISKQKYKIYNSIKLHKNSICLPSSHNLSKLNLKKIIKCLKN